MPDDVDGIRTARGPAARRSPPSGPADDAALPVAGARDRAGAAAGGGQPAGPWRLLVTEHALVAPGDLINHPENARHHPPLQAEALRDAICEIGFMGEVYVSKRSGRILDGHLRVAEALRAGQALVPVGWVACDSDEQELALIATYDPLGALATADKEQLARLAETAGLESASLTAMLASMAGAKPAGRVIGAPFGPQGGGHLGAVPDLVHPVVVECESENDAEALLEELTDQGHVAYLLPPSPTAVGDGS